MNALVDSSAGQGASSRSPQRIAAIGRVFENQGRYTQARQMYRQALKADPRNTTARDRLEYLASIGQGSFQPQQQVADPIAIADAVTKPSRTRSFRNEAKRPAQTRPAERQEISEVRVVSGREDEGQLRSASLVAGELEHGVQEVGNFVEDVAPEVVEWDVQVVETEAWFDDAETVGRTSFESTVETVSETISEFEAVEIGVTSRQQANEQFEHDTDGVVETTEPLTTVASGLSVEGVTTGAAEGPWRPARRVIRLSDVLEWSNEPQAYSAELIEAIQAGADEGVQALAVALLGEISSPDADIVNSLQLSATSGAPIVRAAAFDALVLQGKGDSDTVEGLLSLLAGDDAGVRTQAAGTLHRLAKTAWRVEAVEGLHNLLNDTNDEVVAVAATSLSEFGADAVFCRDRLTAVAAATSSELVLEATSMALSRIPRSAP